MTPWADRKNIATVNLPGSTYKNYSSTLQKLHALNVELILAETTFKYCREFACFCKSVLDLVEKSRIELGLQEMQRFYQKNMEAEIRHKERVLQFLDDKLNELLNRLIHRLTW